MMSVTYYGVLCNTRYERATMSGRPKGDLVLDDSEREERQALTMRRKTVKRLTSRVRIVPVCSDDIDNKAVAAKQLIT
jgi:hypothetical protein